MNDPHATGSSVADNREWAQARNALAFYANPKNWGDDDWGVASVVQPPGYGNPTEKAKRALAALDRLRTKLDGTASGKLLASGAREFGESLEVNESGFVFGEGPMTRADIWDGGR